jgi:signal transduction histidine kinase
MVMKNAALCPATAAGLALLLACAPAAAGVGTASAQPGLLMALCWFAALATGLQALLRRRLAAEDRATALAAELCLERKARAQAEQALADSHAVLRKVVRKQGRVRDAERARIGRDIHDDLGQTMLALRIELSLLQVQTGGIHPALNQRLAAMVGTLDHAIRSLRGVIRDLRPLALDEGLRRAMERQLDEFSRLTGIRHELLAVHGAFDAAGRSPAADALLYRVLQEALSNVARHAQAGLVRVVLVRRGERLTLRIEDDGIGFDGQPQTRGSGLAGMRERVSAEQGELSISSKPGAGTAVALWLPLAPHGVAG